MQRVMDGRAPTLGAATLLLAVLALAFPAFASAAPGCPSSVTMDDVHSGTSQFTALTCDDPSGTGLTYSVDPGNDAQLGFVSLDGSGGVSYFPNADAKGHDGWTVVVADNEGGSTNVAFSVDVVNAPPVCQNTSIDVTHGQQGFVFPDCSDPDGDGFTLHANPASHGTSGASFGGLTYQSEASYAGPDSFTFYASDSVENGDTATASVTVTNSTPACTTDGNQQTLRTGKPITLHVNCFDIDGDPVTVGHSTPAHGTLGAFSDSGFGDYTATYTPSGTYTGPDTFSFTASDGVTSSASADFALTITANHAPQCDDNGAVHARVDTAAPVFFFCSDQDAQDQALTYTQVAGSGPAHGTLELVSDFQATYTPASGFTGQDGFSIRASDGTLSDTYDQVMHVANTPLCTTPPAVQVRSGRSVGVTVDCTFPDDETGPLQYEIGTQPTKGTLNPSGTTFNNFRTYTAGAGAEGADQFTVRLTGSTGSSPFVSQQITTGAAVNHAPVCEDGSFRQTVYSGRPAALFPFCSDADNDQLTFAAGAKPVHGTSSASNGELNYTADTGYVGFDDVPYTASDGHGGSAGGSYAVDVHAPQRPGCVQGTLAATVRPGKTVSLQLNCFSPQDDPQTYSHTAASKGTLGNFNSFGRVDYTANAGATGTDTFTMKATNAVGDSDPVSVTITIDPDFNRAPVCSSNAFNPKRVVTATASTLDFAGYCSDPDGDPLVFVRKSDPAHGSVTAGPSPTLSYTSAAGFTGADNFTFAARDDRGVESPVATHYLDVLASLAPSCTPNPTVTLRPSQARSLTFNCSDPDSRQITYKIVSPAQRDAEPAR